MCGITGFIQLEENAYDVSVLDAMTQALTHRGPDYGDVKWLGNVGLGHRRLSILDLSENGHQPMSDVTGRACIVFNGEIYNYLELREKLIAEGVTFNSNSDTEVLINAYLTWPKDFLERVEGMFAFALYDSQEERLIVARDRFGEKPFYYLHQPDGYFAFASELKAFSASGLLPEALDLVALNAYFELGFVPAPLTPYSQIKTLPAGYSGILDVKTGIWQEEPQEYWTIGKKKPKPMDEQAVFEVFEDLVKESVKKRLQADVPVGVLLSGGLDSSTISTLTRECIGEDVPLHSFSVGFDVPALDESAKASIVAEKLGTTHHQFICGHQDFLEVLDTVLDSTDNLLSEQTVPMYYVSKLAREHVTVALTGDGADEVLGGYNSYHYVSKCQPYLNIPLVSPLGCLTTSLIKAFSFDPVFKRKIGRAQRMFMQPASRAYMGYRYSNTMGQKLTQLFKSGSVMGELLKETMHPFIYLSQRQELCPNGKLVDFDDYMRFDMKTNMAQAILMKSDLMSMTHGLELRAPFLDRDVMTFLYNLPEDLKRQHGSSKWLLREFLKKRGMDSSVWEQKKAGFIAPFGYWLRDNNAFYLAIEGRVFGFKDAISSLGMNQDYLHQLFAEHRDGQCDHNQAIWQILTFLHWYEQYSRAKTPLAHSTGAQGTV